MYLKMTNLYNFNHENLKFAVTQDWLQAHRPGFIEKNQWPQTLQI